MKAEAPPPAPAGWYPDPARTGGLRYFDGGRWTEHRSGAPKAQNKNKWAPRWPLLIPLGVVAVVVALSAWGVERGEQLGTGGSATDTSHAQPEAIDECQKLAKKDLKDPDSAKFDGWTASDASGPPMGVTVNLSAGDSYYLATGMVNAKNGFGGYDGDEPYSCDVVVTTTTIRAQVHSGS
jgi:hypothetical protein